jgi:hypothetical protein
MKKTVKANGGFPDISPQGDYPLPLAVFMQAHISKMIFAA